MPLWPGHCTDQEVISKFVPAALFTSTLDLTQIFGSRDVLIYKASVFLQNGYDIIWHIAEVTRRNAITMADMWVFYFCIHDGHVLSNSSVNSLVSATFQQKWRIIV